MKDSVLFEHVLAELLGCRDEALDERDQREAILSYLVQLQLEFADGEKGGDQFRDLAMDRVRKLEAIKVAAVDLLGAGDDRTWKRARQVLIESIEADQC